MNIVVFNGSPKGPISVTMQYVLFLRKKWPQHQFTIINACQDIHKLQEDEPAFREVLATIAAADGVLWAFPLYFLLVHAHYKRFIELLLDRGGQEVCQGKYAAVLTTSIHFFDHTAHEYLRGICDDLGMKFVDSYSAEMYDLLEEKERQRLLQFGEGFLRAVAEKPALPRRCGPVVAHDFRYQPGPPSGKVDTAGKRILMVTDSDNLNGNLARMVARLRGCFQGLPVVINLHEIKIRSGCLGCCQCGLDNQCVYRDTDDIPGVYAQLRAADVLILAGTIQDRYLSSRWKLFFDRGFYHGHVPILAGKQIGYLIAGPLRQLANLRQILEGYTECEQANLVDIVTDECSTSQELDEILESFAVRLIEKAVAGYVRPATFLSVGGSKIFRDYIWSSLRVVFQADHKYYQSHGLYDFPRRSLKTRITDRILTWLAKIPSFRREFLKGMKKEMVAPLEKVLEKEDGKEV